MKKQNEILLNEKQFIEQAAVLSGALEDLAIIRNLIDFFPSPKGSAVQDNPLFYYRKVNEALGDIFQKLQGIENNIDDVAMVLYSTTDKHELEASGIKIEVPALKTGD